MACSNCGATLGGEYCAACGQRRFRPKDRRMAHLASEFFAALTDLDSRFWRSVRALMLRPGLLTAEWFAGRRVRWMPPVALFLLVNLVYFLMPAITDFDLPLRNHVTTSVLYDYADPERVPPLRDSGGGQWHSRLTEPWVRLHLEARARAIAGGQAIEAPHRRAAFAGLESDYGLASANFSKLLIVLHVPFLALGLQLLMAGSRRYFAEHFVAGLHYFTFVLAFVQFVLMPIGFVVAWLDLPGSGEAPGWAKLINLALLSGYAAAMLRRAYGCSWIRAALGGLALPAILVAVHVTVYRALQFALVLALA